MSKLIFRFNSSSNSTDVVMPGNFVIENIGLNYLHNIATALMIIRERCLIETKCEFNGQTIYFEQKGSLVSVRTYENNWFDVFNHNSINLENFLFNPSEKNHDKI